MWHSSFSAYLPEECHSVERISHLSFGAKIFTGSASGLFFAPKLTFLGGFSSPPATVAIAILLSHGYSMS